MRLLLLALVVLLAPLAHAEPAPTVRQCTSSGCVVVADRDGDGGYDWTNLALVVGEQVVANANANGSRAGYELVATNEELGGHDAEELLGLETHLALSVIGTADATGGAREADALVFVAESDHETGATRTIVWQYAVARDADGDGLPETVETEPALP